MLQPNLLEGKRFYLKCRYLKTDERIEKKVSKVRRNSSVMIVGELTLINSEFNVEIQDLNFLPTSIANIESSATSSSSASSLYSWPATLSSRISAQEMTNTLAPENLAKLWMHAVTDDVTNNNDENNDRKLGRKKEQENKVYIINHYFNSDFITFFYVYNLFFINSY